MTHLFRSGLGKIRGMVKFMSSFPREIPLTDFNSLTAHRTVLSANLPNWRVPGVAKVKNQEETPTCCLFATTTALELAIFRKFNVNLSISVQDVWNGLHSHGTPLMVSTWLKRYGVISEENCPWKGFMELWYRKPGIKVCKFVGRLEKNYVESDFEILKKLHVSPIVIALPSGPCLNYLLNDPYIGENVSCDYPLSHINHCVTLVGADITSDGVPYFIAQNSYGIEWGELGYFKIRMGDVLFNPSGTGMAIFAFQVHLDDYFVIEEWDVEKVLKSLFPPNHLDRFCTSSQSPNTYDATFRDSLCQGKCISLMPVVDNNPKSLLSLYGNESVHGLCDFLQNDRSLLTVLNSMDVPVSCAPLPLLNAALSSPEGQTNSTSGSSNPNERVRDLPASVSKELPEHSESNPKDRETTGDSANSAGVIEAPVGLGGGPQPKRRGQQSKIQLRRGESGTFSSVDQSQAARASCRQVLQSLLSQSTHGRTSSNAPVGTGQTFQARGQGLSDVQPGAQASDGQVDVTGMMSQLLDSPALNGLLSGVAQQTGVGSPNVLRNMLQQFTQNPAMRNTVIQIAQQVDRDEVRNMFMGTGTGQGSNLDFSSMLQQMMPVVSQFIGCVSVENEQMQNLMPELPPQVNRMLSRDDRSLGQGPQSDIQAAVQQIAAQGSSQDVFRALIQIASENSGTNTNSDEVTEWCSSNEKLVEVKCKEIEVADSLQLKDSATKDDGSALCPQREKVLSQALPQNQNQWD